MDGCKEICQRQTEMEKARRPMFQQELEELRSLPYSLQLFPGACLPRPLQSCTRVSSDCDVSAWLVSVAAHRRP